jgi:hypothetical protein
MNRVPGDTGTWSTAPFEAQYLKVYDVTAPVNSSGSAMTTNSYSYALGTSGTISWAAAAPDSEGVTPCYQVSVTINGNTTSFVTCGTSTTINAAPGQTASVVIQTVNPNDNSMTGPATSPTLVKFIDVNGDDDGDGLTNGKEDLAGTNPFDPRSNLAVTTLTIVDANNASLSWATVTGKDYQVQSATAPGPGSGYSSVGPVVPGTGGIVSRSVPLSSGIYYRIVVVP